MELGVSEDMLSRVFDGLGRPIDGGPEILPEKRMDINGLPMNPAAQKLSAGIYPDRRFRHRRTEHPGARPEAADLFRLRSAPRQLGGADRPSGEGARHQQNLSRWCSLLWVSPLRKRTSSSRAFKETGAIDRTVMFVNLANDPAVERIATPRMALTAAEYLAFEKNMHVLVILTDITNYADALREVSAARKEVPGRRGYPGYMYTDLASLYERAGRQKGKNGSITMIPILTMPEDDKTHPDPRPDRIHHRGTDHPEPRAVPQGRDPAHRRAAQPVPSEG